MKMEILSLKVGDSKLEKSKNAAKARAKRLGFKQSDVTKSEKNDRHYIPPHGVTSSAGKQAYADTRASGKSKEEAAKISHYVEKKSKDSKSKGKSKK